MESNVRSCPIARTLDLVGSKWTLLAVREMTLGNHRFEEIVRRTGAPRDILTDRLRRLESDGLVSRVEYAAHPKRFEYRLTDRGVALGPILATLREFGDSHLSSEPASDPDGDHNGDADDPASVMIEHACGHRFRPVLTCGACGAPATHDDLRVRHVHE